MTSKALSQLTGLLGLALDWLRRLVSRKSSGNPKYTPSPSPNVCQIHTIPWGNVVSQTFRDRVVWIANSLEVPVDWPMGVMAFETAGTFRADIANFAGSGATGLIQFMPATAKDLGTSTLELSAMSPEDQLNYVYRYFLPYRGRLHSLSDMYMAVLWPRAIGKPENYILWNKAMQPTTFRQNAGLDINGDGGITKAEAASLVLEQLERGKLPGKIWTGEVWPDGNPNSYNA